MALATAFILCKELVTVTILAHGTGAVDIDTLASTRSEIVQDSAVAGHVANNVQRLLRKHEPVHGATEHDTESSNEERDVSAAVKAFAEKLKSSIWIVGKAIDDVPKLKGLGTADHIDESISAMLAEKNADHVYKDVMARVITTFKTLDEQELTPNIVKTLIAEKKVDLSSEEALYFEPLFSSYWKAAHAGKNLE
ncbi:hypothetical protein GN958_ATG21522 [Phytophthora infestans]|uniref:RxLR effector protein n=1 Tax=Phytophthora infestans TaxID=4787 RepID=A0A8S9TTG5_PHYIN|nr:hypothetical protein GN958_ATG21522 [Phytophthora infestans]